MRWRCIFTPPKNGSRQPFRRRHAVRAVIESAVSLMHSQGPGSAEWDDIGRSAPISDAGLQAFSATSGIHERQADGSSTAVLVGCVVVRAVAQPAGTEL